ncbi:hypothetical protein C8F01DRAFT_1117760 [Mycena amicta]|nr:hypothetical protein C8F01DRAFT_1117760 [Mycena amicta]
MNSELDPTTKFQQALPLVLPPGLAAVHAVRVGAENTCKQCGCPFHSGESSVRLVRGAVKTTCLVCGWSQAVAAPRRNAGLFPPTRKHKHIPPKVAEPDTNVNVPAQVPQADTRVDKSRRPKKKSGLQAMLEKSRERDAMEKNKAQSTALSMFLNTL